MWRDSVPRWLHRNATCPRQAHQLGDMVNRSWRLEPKRQVGDWCFWFGGDWQRRTWTWFAYGNGPHRIIARTCCHWICCERDRNQLWWMRIAVPIVTGYNVSALSGVFALLVQQAKLRTFVSRRPMSPLRMGRIGVRICGHDQRHHKERITYKGLDSASLF